MLVKLENGNPIEWPVSYGRIKHENKNTSFPADFSQVDIAAYGFANFQYSDAPEYDQEYQNCVEITPVLTDGVYVQTWQITEKYTSEQKAAHDKLKEETRIAGLPETHRTQRDILLAETDWWAMPDSPTMTDEQNFYRQQLRDITTHSNWPDLQDSDWPTKP